MAKSKCCVYDLTIPLINITQTDLASRFENYCKKWVFQAEKGDETGYLHWQCRISTKVKCALKQVIEKFKDLTAHVSTTSTQNMGNDFYCTKEESRVEGPWRDTDEKPGYVQKRFRGEFTWKPWQQSVLNSMELTPDDRTINVIFDPQGNHGKSFLSSYCAQHGLARVLPSLNDYKEIVQFAMSFPTRSTYFLDMPRGLPKKHLNGIYSGLENMKNGWLFETRYHGRELWFEPPHIWVYTNVMPGLTLLSADRWKLWEINDEQELVEYLPE